MHCFKLSSVHGKVAYYFRSKPLLLVHGFTGSEKTEFEGEAMNYENVDLVQVGLLFFILVLFLCEKFFFYNALVYV